MRPLIGILGGTFNPIHYAHLRLAEELADALSLQSVRIIPASIPPHRETPRVSAHDRLEMVKLACADNARLVVDDRECRRFGPSYTVDTLRELRDEFGTQQPLCLLMGVDAFVALVTWSRWEQLFDLAHVAIAQRPGFVLDAAVLAAPLARQLETRRTEQMSELHMHPSGLLALCTITALDISGTAIRTSIARGRSPRYLLPDSVLDYIHQRQLYKDLDAR
jgi:nicotinate-nucleotide adenylyltransferase